MAVEHWIATTCLTYPLELDEIKSTLAQFDSRDERPLTAKSLQAILLFAIDRK